MKKTILRFAFAAIAIPALFSSCATIVSRSTYPIAIDAEPMGTTVSITDKKNKEVFKGQTPATATLKSGAGFFSKAEYQVKLSAPGYQEQVIPINFKINGWYFGNLLIGGFIGMLIVDPATGAMWKMNTPPIKVALNKATESAETPTLKVIDIATISPEMRAQLVQIK